MVVVFRAPTATGTLWALRLAGAVRSSCGTNRPTRRGGGSGPPAGSPTAITCGPASSPASARSWCRGGVRPEAAGPGDQHGFHVLAEAPSCPGPSAEPGPALRLPRGDDRGPSGSTRPHPLVGSGGRSGIRWPRRGRVYATSFDGRPRERWPGLFRYVAPDGRPPSTRTGGQPQLLPARIAGHQRCGNVAGLMPHPEGLPSAAGLQDALMCAPSR